MLDQSVLAQFTGTEAYHPFSGLFRNMLLTDGAKYLAESQGAYWLMDVIASHQPKILRKSERCRDFQLWVLKVNKKGGCTVSCYADSGEKPVVSQRIEYTDFDPAGIELYCNPVDERRRVILLKSEY